LIALSRREHPLAARLIGKLLGRPLDATDPAYEQFVQMLCGLRSATLAALLQGVHFQPALEAVAQGVGVRPIAAAGIGVLWQVVHTTVCAA